MKIVFLLWILLFSFSSIAEERKILAHVKDMTCPMCAAAVESEVEKVKGFKKVKIDISNGIVTVIGTDLNIHDVSQAINKTKFKITKIKTVESH